MSDTLMTFIVGQNVNPWRTGIYETSGQPGWSDNYKSWYIASIFDALVLVLLSYI